MTWFNYYGLIIVAIMMIPNIVCVIFDKQAFQNYYHNKLIETIEQIGRFACFALMIFNIPYTYLGFWFSGARDVYLTVNCVLLFTYCLGWIVFCKSDSLIKVLWLSFIPIVIFAFSGIMLLSVPLILFSVLFGVGHINFSVINFKLKENKK